MDDFDSVKFDFQSRLLDAGMTVEQAETALSAFCMSMQGYSIRKEETALIPFGTVPKEVYEYIASKKMEGRANGTVRNYQRVLEGMFTAVRKPIEQITHKDIWGYLLMYQSERPKPVSNRTMNYYLGVIKYFFAWLQDVGYITNNPTRSIKPIHYEKKQRKAMTRRDLLQVIKACETPRERAIISLMYATGCRISEMAIMKLDDIDWHTRRIKVMGKGKKERFVYYNDSAEIYLSEYLETRHDKSLYVFVSARGAHGVTTDSMRKWIESACRRVTDISTKVTPHIIRHTTATLALQSGMPVTTVQQILGHEQIGTTMEYIDMDKMAIQSDYDKHVL